MPNSSWTESGASINLTPTTTTVTGTANQDSPNYLTNADKIALMAQYSAELAMKTTLDTTAASLSVSSSYYDNAVAAISTALINAGAPSNWATTWPDGTTSGPWGGIQPALANLWAQVATQRTALQSSISSAQASAAFAASLAVPTVVSSLPSLPSSSYPAGAYVFNTSTNMMYESTGSVWVALTVAGSSLVANSVTAAQIAANTITAAQISSGYIYAGNISANQITAGTLSGTNVNITNLNASNITTGTLSASKVLFGDGSALTTASRVQTQKAVQTSPVTAAGVTGDISLPGLSFSVTAASTSDTFNLFGTICLELTSGTAGDGCQIGVLVDGVESSESCEEYMAVKGAGLTQSVPVAFSLTGLSAGAHTLQIYMKCGVSADTFKAYTSSKVICQRVF